MARDQAMTCHIEESEQTMYNLDLLDRIGKTDTKLRSYEKYEGLSDPVWKRIKVKDTSVPAYQPYNNMKVLYERQTGLKVQLSAPEGPTDERKFGPSEKHRLLTEVFTNSGTTIEVASGTQVSVPVVVQLGLNEDNPLLLDRHLITVGRDASLTVVFDYSGSLGYSSSLLEIKAEANAQVHVVKIQNMEGDSTHIHGAFSDIGRDGHVKYNSIDLGGALTVTDYSTYMNEENGSATVESIYLGEGKNKLDLGYNIYHKGPRTTSDVTVKGALMDESRKVFRGNLFFAKGAKKAQGGEEEYVILLDERVKADAIPALLCDEDDVQGEHAASAGQVDDGKLFYLMSRGLTEKEAKQLIIMASFAPVIEQLPIDGLKDRILETVGEKLTQDLA